MGGEMSIAEVDAEGERRRAQVDTNASANVENKAMLNGWRGRWLSWMNWRWKCSVS